MWVDGYRKTLNHRKIHQKIKRTTYWKPKEYYNRNISQLLPFSLPGLGALRPSFPPSVISLSVPSNNFSILICKSSVRIKENAISVGFKTPLKIGSVICINKTSLLHRPITLLVSHQAASPYFTTKLRLWVQGILRSICCYSQVWIFLKSLF